MLDFAIRKSENALERVLFRVVLSAVALLGLVWLSIAATGWLALAVPPPAAAAITGGIFIGITVIAYFVARAGRAEAKASAEDSAANSHSKTDDVVARAIALAERMAPDTPLAAFLFALLAGIGSVSLPAAVNPFLSKILDDFEKSPDVRVRN